MKSLTLLKNQLENQKDSDIHHLGLTKLSTPTVESLLQGQMFLKCAMLKRLFNDMRKQSMYYTEIHNTTLLWVYVIQCKQFCKVFTTIRRNEVNYLQKQLGLKVNGFEIL